MSTGPPNVPAPGAFNPYSPPSTSIEAPASTSAAGYRSALSLAKAMGVVLGLDALVEVIGDVHGFITISVMEKVVAGEEVPEAQLSGIDVRTGAIAALGLILLITIIVQFCLFMPRANRNARAFGSHLSITPRWAAGFFFTPIANLWKPYQAMKEIWQGSDPDPNVYAFNVKAPAVMKWWWGFYLLHNFGGQVVFRMAKTAPTPAELIANTWAEIITSTFSITAAILAALTVRAVAMRQEARQRRHPAGSPPPGMVTAGVAP